MLANALVKIPRLATTAEAHCEVAQALADELGCAVRVRQALGYAFERWDGKGIPKRLKGEAIARAARVVQVADDAQTFQRAAGLDAALAMLDERAGKAHDPMLGKLMRGRAAELLAASTCRRSGTRRSPREPGPPDYVPSRRNRRRAARDGRVRGPQVLVHARALGGVAELAAREASGSASPPTR